MSFDYPEHEKLHQVSAETQAAGAFLEWMRTRGYVVCEWVHKTIPPAYDYSELHLTGKSISDLLAEWKGIDKNRLEEEKRQMLAAMRGER